MRMSVLLYICTIYVFLLTVRGHSHINENPGFKYSKEANEKLNSNPEHHNHDMHRGHNYAEGEKPVMLEDVTNVWLHAIGSTLIISAAPFVVLFIIPLDSSEAMRPRLKVILAFAAGGLLGDSFLHLIPHSPHKHEEIFHDSITPHNHKHSDDLFVGLWVLSGIIAFLAVEKSVRLLKHDQGHSHSNHSTQPSKEVKNQSSSTPTERNLSNHEDIDISGYLNLAADFAHNFTDGLAIGASYIAGTSIGIITTLTILLHEVPHEIGDFAILIKSGCSKRKAMMLQLLTAVGALGGTLLALISAQEDTASASWILPFTAGGFIYIATVSVLPELLQDSTKFFQSFKEIIALLIGVFLMVGIAKIE